VFASAQLVVNGKKQGTLVQKSLRQRSAPSFGRKKTSRDIFREQVNPFFCCRAYSVTRKPEAGSLKMELMHSSKFKRSLGRSVIENVLKSCTNELA
jgi:hypothetical protein